MDGKLIVWEGHRLRGVLSERKNPHRQLYKDIQDDALRSEVSGLECREFVLREFSG